MTLHILFTSGGAGDAVSQCLEALAEGDALLLLADGVFAALASGAYAGRLAALPARVTIHALDEDCRARGILERLQPRVVPVDYGGFVELTCAQPRSVSWF